jgi:hypothetical protein
MPLKNMHASSREACAAIRRSSGRAQGTLRVPLQRRRQLHRRHVRQEAWMQLGAGYSSTAGAFEHAAPLTFLRFRLAPALIP